MYLSQSIGLVRTIEIGRIMSTEVAVDVGTPSGAVVAVSDAVYSADVIPNTQGRTAKDVPLTSIIIPALLLRDAQTNDDKYQALKNSIQKHGIRFPLVVTPGLQKHTYVLSDGTQRLSIAKELGLENVPCIVENMSESDAFLTQMEMNLTKVEATKTQYAAFVIKFANKYPGTTVPEIATRLGQPPSFIKDLLKFTKLSTTVQTAVDEGAISLSKAVMLTGLDKEHQDKLVEDSLSLTQDAFADRVKATKSEIAKAKAEGRAVGSVEYIHSYGSRPKAELIAVLDDANKLASIVGSAGTPMEAATLLLRWTLKDDDASRAAGLQTFNEEKQAAAEKKARREAEKEAKKAAATAAVVDAAAATRG